MATKHGQRAVPGPRGPAGKTGKRGRPGRTGKTGARGVKGARGSTGQTGVQGDDPASAHAQALTVVHEQIATIYNHIEIQLKRMAAIQAEVDELRDTVNRLMKIPLVAGLAGRRGPK